MATKPKEPKARFWLVELLSSDDFPAILVEEYRQILAFKSAYSHMFDTIEDVPNEIPSTWSVKPLTDAEAVGMVAVRMAGHDTALSVLLRSY